MAAHLWWYITCSARALELFICDELLPILPRSCSNSWLVFALFVILFRDWIFPLQLWILNVFMSLKYHFLPSTSRSSSSLFLVGFRLRFFFRCFFSPSYVAVASQLLCLSSFHDVVFLRSFLDLWVRNSLVDFFHCFLWAVDFPHYCAPKSYSSSLYVSIIVSAPYVTIGRITTLTFVFLRISLLPMPSCSHSMPDSQLEFFILCFSASAIPVIYHDTWIFKIIHCFEFVFPLRSLVFFLFLGKHRQVRTYISKKLN